MRGLKLSLNDKVYLPLPTTTVHSKFYNLVVPTGKTSYASVKRL